MTNSISRLEDLPLQTAELIAGRYRILDVLGVGGIGTVYKALDERLNRPVAVKVLHARLQVDSTPRSIFEHEARVTALLRHPGILHVYDFGESTIQYLVTEYINGFSLKRILAAHGKLGIADALAIVELVADALAYAHGQGVIHLDIKPSNILVDGTGHVVVSDFGLARVSGSREYVEDGIVAGTIAYMSPEQFGGKPLDKRSDVFSLGMVFYEALTGMRPFERNTLPPIQSWGDQRIIPDMTGIPDFIRGAVQHSLEFDPSARFESMDLLLEAVQQSRRYFELSEPGADLRSSSERSVHSTEFVGLPSSMLHAAGLEQLVLLVQSPTLADDTQIHDIATVNGDLPVPELFEAMLLNKRADSDEPMPDGVAAELHPPALSPPVSKLDSVEQRPSDPMEARGTGLMGKAGAGDLPGGRIKEKSVARDLPKVSQDAYQLIISAPEGQPVKVALMKSPLTLGRSVDNDLAYPDDPWLSRYHLSFEQRERTWCIRDHESRNGTLLNSAGVKTSKPIKAGDKIFAGHLTIEVRPRPTAAERPVISFRTADDGSTGSIIVSTLDKVLGKTSEFRQRLPDTAGSRMVSALIRAGQELVTHQPLEQLFETILELSLSAVEAKRGVILTLDGGELLVRASRGDGFAISATVRDQVLRDRVSFLINDAQRHDALSKQESIVLQRIRSMMAAPLQTGDRVIGLIYVDNGAVVRHFSQDDLDLLTVMANVAAIRIEHARLAEVEQSEKLMEAELAQASEIQQSLLPTEALSVKGFELAGYHLPCRTVGGDYYDFVPYNDGRIALVLGDVSGKGLPAALLMSSLQARVQMLAATAPDPASALGALNRGLTERTPLGRFFTAFYGVLDPAKGTLKYSNAGYGYPILVRCSGATESLTGSGLVMGLFSTVSYPAMTVQLEVGDLLVLYSDGLNETVNIHDEEFGTERIANIVLASKQRSAQDILRALSESLEAWRGGLPFSDDVTMVVLRRVTS